MMVFKAMRPSEITRETWVEERSPRRSPRTAPNGWEDDKALARDRPGQKEQGRSGFVCPDESVEWRVCVGKPFCFHIVLAFSKLRILFVLQQGDPKAA